MFSVTKGASWKLKHLNTEVMLALIGNTDGMQFNAICQTVLPKDVQEAISIDPTSMTGWIQRHQQDRMNNALTLVKTKIKQLIKLGLLKEVKGRDRIVYQLTELGQEFNTYECTDDPGDPLKNLMHIYKLIMDTEYKYIPVQPVEKISLSVTGRILSPLAIQQHIQAYLEKYDQLDPVIRGAVFGNIQSEMLHAGYISSIDVANAFRLLIADKSK